ncbi:MAG: HAD family hydrolase [Gemmatimonadaceae bacterium]
MRSQRFDLRALPLFFGHVPAEEIGRTKPHPDPYLKTVEKLGLNSEACMVIEDSKNGILSAKDAGCVVVAITTSFSRKELEEATADYTVESFAELASLLELDADGANWLREQM